MLTLTVRAQCQRNLTITSHWQGLGLTLMQRPTSWRLQWMPIVLYRYRWGIGSDYISEIHCNLPRVYFGLGMQCEHTLTPLLADLDTNMHFYHCHTASEVLSTAFFSNWQLFPVTYGTNTCEHIIIMFPWTTSLHLYSLSLGTIFNDKFPTSTFLTRVNVTLSVTSASFPEPSLPPLLVRMH